MSHTTRHLSVSLSLSLVFPLTLRIYGAYELWQGVAQLAVVMETRQVQPQRRDSMSEGEGEQGRLKEEGEDNNLTDDTEMWSHFVLPFNARCFNNRERERERTNSNLS